MKKRYVFTDAEYNAIRGTVQRTYNYIEKRVAEGYEDRDIIAYHDLKFALDVLDGDIELRGDTQ